MKQGRDKMIVHLQDYDQKNKIIRENFESP